MSEYCATSHSLTINQNPKQENNLTLQPDSIWRHSKIDNHSRRATGNHSEGTIHRTDHRHDNSQNIQWQDVGIPLKLQIWLSKNILENANSRWKWISYYSNHELIHSSNVFYRQIHVTSTSIMGNSELPAVQHYSRHTWQLVKRLCGPSSQKNHNGKVFAIMELGSLYLWNIKLFSTGM